MTRKAFLADVAAASGKLIPNVTAVVRGDDDGDVNFNFVPPSGKPFTIALLALDVAGYPAENYFMIFTNSSDIPNGVNAALEDVATLSAGMRITELVSTISTRLQSLLATGSKNAPFGIDDDDDADVDMIDSAAQDEDDESEEEGFGYSDDDDTFGAFGNSNGVKLSGAGALTEEAAAALNRRIKEDLRLVRFSDFKFGVLSGMKADSHTSLLSISIQAAKLGLSEEALQAWDLLPHQYVVLLLKYSSGYKSFDVIMEEAANNANISFRIGVCDKYKPSVAHALAAFTEMTNTKPSNNENHNPGAEPSTSFAAFSSIFISSSLNEFLNEKFVSLLKIRYSTGLGWDGAKHYFNDNRGRECLMKNQLPPHYYVESTPKQSSLPSMVYADHLMEDHDRGISFPLIAAQFALRSLLRCTEFCLVCHDRIEADFEALKPYVCDKPLCLYQYMSLGFGPSIEHEILTQPYVVDLLVSFCYVAALNQRIREYPTGMSLSVPSVSTSVTSFRPTSRSFQPPILPAQVPVEEPPNSAVDVKFDLCRQELLFDNSTTCQIRRGDWIVINHVHQSLHFRVEDTSFYPNVKLAATPVTARRSSTSDLTSNTAAATPATPATTPPPSSLVPAKMSIYNQNFDDMTPAHKAETIVMLLETLPTITELRKYLLDQSRSSEPNLRLWKDRISPAALGLLRWIIASNRSCIVQVDKCPGQEDHDQLASKIRLDQKCSNIGNGWVQFRFAQGSPDKEQRFLNALKTEQSNLDANHPTLFAFHGSPLQNWHSIIRHGLDFVDTLHGRAFGNGVYHAMDQNISIGYAPAHSTTWPGSELKINSAMSLNEIVNCPTKFQSSSPYLVVQHVDWIQCRYLLVQVGDFARGTLGEDTTKNPDSAEVKQDPKFTARSTLQKPVGIPQCAVSVSKAFRATKNEEKSGGKRRKQSSGSLEFAGTISDEDDMEDVNFLFSDAEDNFVGKQVPKVPAKPLTDFVAGSLDQECLPMLEPPAYATPSATMRLNKELKAILKVQETTPSHELGWYINPELISNVYQWIVELHSFEETLPLAKDMKAASVTSIVLELRFGKDFPHSPPFVRVIRPRFLPFTQGGGGHVTMGGAMCMELLTNSGWSAVSSIEGVLLQVRLAIMNLEPKPARLMHTGKQQQIDYGTGEAIAAYIRACQAHGWEVPKDFKDFASQGSDGMY